MFLTLALVAPAGAQIDSPPKAVQSVRAELVRAGEGAELVLTVRLGEGLAHLTSVKYPEAHEKRFGFSPKALRVYEGEFAIRVLFKSVPPRDGGKLSGVVRYQACTDDACLPPAQESFTVSIDGA
jgi:hypothetical protein